MANQIFALSPSPRALAKLVLDRLTSCAADTRVRQVFELVTATRPDIYFRQTLIKRDRG